MEYIKVIVTTFNILFCLIFIFFSWKLRWKNESERASIIGYGTMFALYLLNSLLIWK